MSDARIGGAWRSATTAEVRVGTAWKRVIRSEIYTGGAWKTGETFAQALTATTSDAYPSGTRVGAGYCATATVTITPAGGVAPFTYAWVKLSGNGSVNNPTGAATTFFDNIADGAITTGAFRCTVTDALGSTVTVDEAATFESIGGL